MTAPTRAQLLALLTRSIVDDIITASNCWAALGDLPTDDVVAARAYCAAVLAADVAHDHPGRAVACASCQHPQIMHGADGRCRHADCATITCWVRGRRVIVIPCLGFASGPSYPVATPPVPDERP